VPVTAITAARTRALAFFENFMNNLS